jgi:Alkaline phosphatase PhoX
MSLRRALSISWFSPSWWRFPSLLVLVSCGIAGSVGLAPAATTTAALPTATSSSQTAYVVSTAPGWTVVPLLTVGDTPGGSSYAMVGKPDGLGALKGRISSDGVVLETTKYLTILMNHELADWRGAVRAHGTTGAFVSQWTVDLNTLQVVAGRDLVRRTYAFANRSWGDVTGALAFDRLCSADLPATTALFNSQTGRGFRGRMFLNAEEATPDGRAFGHVATGDAYGKSYELPHLGKYAHENVLANPKSGDMTLVVSLDDSTPGQVYVYVGYKKSVGNPVQRAGLTAGRLYGIKVVDGGAKYGGGAVPRENAGAINGRFTLAEVSAYALKSGSELQAASEALGVTDFARPEDGHWDIANPRVFYWATTGAAVDGVWQSARLYKLTFDSITNPTGGTIQLVIDSAALTGTDGAKARGFDNVTVDGAGRVVVQEDGGDNAYIAKIWRVDPVSRSAVQLFKSDPNRFTPGAAGFLTKAEENSGVIEITQLVRDASWFETGRRYYLGTNQAHYWNGATLVEGGQLYLFASPK